jgi:crotonobetainyl-CoA:carnitine CoA-transferase CaiB-like acyl-CoA transferase
VITSESGSWFGFRAGFGFPTAVFPGFRAFQRLAPAAGNCGKLGVTANLSTECGREVVRRLADWSEVVLESFSPGQLQRWGWNTRACLRTTLT